MLVVEEEQSSEEDRLRLCEICRKWKSKKISVLQIVV